MLNQKRFENFMEDRPTFNNKENHRCGIHGMTDGYGPAVILCVEADNTTLWVSNDEYASQVNYCPKCGYEAKVKIK